ncbi:MAG: PAS domain S-box [Solidesulfovibrio magneticus str. Maddingley MBC34]|uniref:histidine kinase n=1 Tax=Solidesulfovibrio magneticus str. Maddingley MBC34 TaxID=1206767 RepID=K6FJ67_9BACT|nr:MAG: PAS domain S-box [Solidesulfovibrio magneticus str. Maddingley MBC34]
MPPESAAAWTEQLPSLLAREEPWLMERVLAHAKAQGYTAYTSTLVEAWRVSVAGLSAAVTAALNDDPSRLADYPAETPDLDDPVTAFAVREAALHRGRGISLAMFWGLLKYYRQAYLELLEARPDVLGDGLAQARVFVTACFERMEYAFVLRWEELSEKGLHDSLARDNRALANEKNKYLTVFETVPHALFLLDAAGALENANTLALALLGRESASGALYYGGFAPQGEDACAGLSGKPLAELLPWLAPVLAAPAGQQGSHPSVDIVVELDGVERRFSVMAEALRDISDKFAGKVVLCRDVTERRATENALARSEELYRSLVEAMHQGVAVLSPEGRVDFANQTLCDLLGRPMDAVISQPLFAFLGHEDHGRFMESLAARAQGQADPYELRLRRPDGRTVVIMASPSPLVGPDGDYQGSLEVFTDITRLRQLELQLATAKRLEAIGQLAGGVAHEINTPLQYLAGNLDFAQNGLAHVLALLDKYETALGQAEGGPGLETAKAAIEAFRRDNDLEMLLAELPQALAESRHGADRVAAFVRSIKRFAQTESLGRRAIDVNEAIRATVEVAKSAQEYPITMCTDLATDLPPLPCVPGDFNQLLLCLLINAAQAIEPKPDANGRIDIVSRRQGQAIAITVADTGKGIPAELQDKIFDPFFTTRDVGKGGGQGLAIALSIVQKHKGDIRFASEPGQGTTFQVTFPLE